MTTSRRLWARPLRWFLLVVLLAVLGRFLYVSRHEVAEAFGHLTVGGLAILLALEVANSWLNGFRLFLVAREHGDRVTRGGAVRLYLVGRFLNGFFPQAGNVYRGVQFKRLFGVGLGAYASMLAAFSWLSLILTLLLAVGVLLVAPSAPAGVDPLPAVLAVLAVLLVAPWLVRAAAALAVRMARPRPVVADWAGRFHALLQALLGSVLKPRLTVPFVASTLLSFVLWIAYFGVAFASLGLRPGPAALAVMVCLVRLGSVLTLTPGNVGVLELASGALMGWLGFSVADGVLTMALLRAVSLMVSAGLALAVGWRDVAAALRARQAGRRR